MGSSRRSQAKSPQNARSTRSTRSSKGRLLTTDPNETAAQLTNQLSLLGLYAAPTLGDGNCLFRALSDQFYGSPSKHVQVRKDICDWIEQHKERYEGFVDEDEFGGGPSRGKGSKLDVYLRRMRENATYGGHMELSAFAHMTRRNVKVIQPGLVYVIQWNPSKPLRHNDGEDSMDEDDKKPSPRRRQKRDKNPSVDSDEEDGPTIYVAYHDWEHFSSIRNLKGPHVGLPCIEETPPPPAAAVAEVPKKKITKVKLKLSEPKDKENAKPSSSSSSKPSSSSSSKQPASRPISTAAPSSSDPSQIPLPPSIVPSPAPSRSLSPIRPTAISPLVAETLAPPRVQRSPKRSFDESSASSEGSKSAGSAGKRRRTRLNPDSMDVDPPDTISELSDPEEESDSSSDAEDAGGADADETLKTPFLSPAGSSTSSSSLTSLSSSMSSSNVNITLDLMTGGDSPLSSLPSPTPSPPPEPQPVLRVKQDGRERRERPLTRRERKRLGLPKPRPNLSSTTSSSPAPPAPPTSTASPSNKIVIPGGRYLRSHARVAKSQENAVEPNDEDDDDDDANAEWRTNGSGRVDVRGFRELKI